MRGISQIYVVIKIALRALGRNKMRSALTMLGVVIGVGAVIAMVAVGQGASKAVQAQIASMGSNVLMVHSGSSFHGGVRGGAGSVTTLTEDDAKAIERESSAIDLVAPTLRTATQVISSNQNWSTMIIGTTPSYQFVRSWPIESESGSFFKQSDQDGASKVAVLGKTVSDNLFGSQYPINQTVRIWKIPFRVIGVLSGKGQSAQGQDQDDIVIIPLSTMQKRILGVTNIGSIFVSARSPEDTFVAQQQIADLLRQRHHIQPGQDDDFSIRNFTDVAATADATTRILTILLGSIASVSLIVGGIGIMNIMLVSVTERTREIGIRMAEGARERDILIQFLVESAVISILGGLIGILLGTGISYLISSFAQWPTLISKGSIILAFLFSGSVGLFFGFYPAFRASRMDPAEALRYE